ncbi:hypothetical protein ASG12_07760 [Williamsia sp. Leaf354]|uniref:hypothetical protein n=1 Tax=Williamsia sp. Leaf354 TaxID=1736349 RepID=UPI0006F2C4F9|nr:hypothetical protein [Williamsia sp. Leaf354]KQS00747.1 hypothetical protein ASG12_07760 [Williamsia sp. Leaf354]
MKVVLGLLVLAGIVGFSGVIGWNSLTHQDFCDGVQMSSGDRCRHIARTAETLIPAAEVGTGPGQNGASISGQMSNNRLQGTIFLVIAALATIAVGAVAAKKIISRLRTV